MTPEISAKEKGVTRFALSPTTILICISAVAAVSIHFFVVNQFGIFRDELYYIACSDHLAFGYVDQPPFSILLLKGVRIALGDSLFALRLLPILAGGLFILLTAQMAKELGGNKFARILAALAAFAALGNYFSFHTYSMNFLDILFWQVLILLLIRIVKTGDQKLWIVFGLVAGLGLQNKISILFLLFGMGVGLILTSHRKHFRSRYFWMGAGLAALIFLPYLVWNAVHDWPTLEFIHNARTFKMASVTPLSFFLGQFLH